MSASAPASSSPLAAARSLADELRARSAEVEANRTLPDDLVARLSRSGLFRFWVPAEYGGAEVPVVEGLDTFVELARHDAAVAWCVFIANTTALLASRLPPEPAAALFGRADAVAGGFAQPTGRARVVDGGLRVSGRWQWGSGTRHCTTIGGGALLVDDDGAPAARTDGLRTPFVFLDPADVEILDTWHVLGLRGTGSADYQVADAFVPEGRWVADPTGPPVVDGPLYRLSFYGLLAAGVGCTAIGLADRAVEAFAGHATAAVPQSSRRTLAHRPSAQADVARAEATVASAAAYLRDVMGSAWETAVRGDDPSVEQRRLMRLATTDATQRCADVVQRLHRAAGGEAVYQRSPLERLLRDASVVTQHAMAAERTYELAGRLRLGLETDTRTL